MNLQRLAFAPIALVLVSCATPVPKTETAATVIAKIEHSKLRQLKGMSSSQVADSIRGQYGPNADAVAGSLSTLFTSTRLGELLGMTQTITIFAYTLRTNDGREATVLDEYPGFQVGDCLKVFALEQPGTNPRIAYGTGCLPR